MPDSQRLHAMVARMRTEKESLLEDFLGRIVRGGLLSSMPAEVRRREVDSIYDHYVEALAADTGEGLRAYARRFAERVAQLDVEVQEVMGIVLILRDVLARFIKFFHARLDDLTRILDEYQPAANHVIAAVSTAFVQERERIIRRQREAIREQSTQVLRVRERLLILPVVGLVDPVRAGEITEQVLWAIRSTRARAVVIDVTGVPFLDAPVAERLVQVVESCRLLGAEVLLSGLSTHITRTLVNQGVDLASMHTAGDLQRGIEMAQDLVRHGPAGDQAAPGQAKAV